MRRVNRLNAFIITAAFGLTAAASAAVGYGAGVVDGSNMYLTYPSFGSLISRPAKPSPEDKDDLRRYEDEGKEYVDAAERYLNNVLNDVTKISAEAETASAEANDFISEYNAIMQENY